MKERCVSVRTSSSRSWPRATARRVVLEIAALRRDRAVPPRASRSSAGSCRASTQAAFEAQLAPRTTGARRRAARRRCKRLNLALKNPPYNLVIHTAPNRDADHEYYHWHIEIMPKLTKVAGFEWGSGFYINPTPPEDAAPYLREIRDKDGTAHHGGPCMNESLRVALVATESVAPGPTRRPRRRHRRGRARARPARPPGARLFLPAYRDLKFPAGARRTTAVAELRVPGPARASSPRR
jgi:hypothetical protein